MIGNYVSHDASGRIVSVILAKARTIDRIGYTGTLLSLGEEIEVSSRDQYIAEGKLSSRPRWTPPSPSPAPLAVDLSGLPADANFVIRNEDGDSRVIPVGEGLLLNHAGEYTLTIDAPFPFVSGAYSLQVLE